MPPENNLAKIEAVFEAVSARDIDRFLSYLDPDFRLEVIIKPLALHQQGTFNGKEGFRYYIDLLFTSFPDFHMDRLSTRVDGSMVYQEIVIHGTHEADFTLPNGVRVPATHLRVDLPIENYNTFTPDGRFISTTAYVNILDVIKQFRTK